MKDSGADTRWQQVNLWCDGWRVAEQMAVMHLGPLLAEAEHAGTAALWWFVRKGASWRLRVLPAAGQDDEAAAFLKCTMEVLIRKGAIRSWAATIYEPEVRAFGGPNAMDVAHVRFHADSRHLLHYFAQSRKDHRRADHSAAALPPDGRLAARPRDRRRE